MDPLFFVAETKYIVGIDVIPESMQEDAWLKKYSLKDLCETEFISDAHFVSYCIPGEEKIPRLRKPIVGQLLALGTDVLVHSFIFDWDNPGHEAWTEESFNNFLNSLHTISQSKFPLLSEYTIFYTTRNGARFVFVLEEPIKVVDSEDYYKSL